MLYVAFVLQVNLPCSHTNLLPLTGLTNLQSLSIKKKSFHQWDDNQAAPQLAVQQFPRRLTSLTQLCLNLNVVHDVSCVGGCLSLRDLCSS